jgi:hypothetical protein
MWSVLVADRSRLVPTAVQAAKKGPVTLASKQQESLGALGGNATADSGEQQSEGKHPESHH